MKRIPILPLLLFALACVAAGCVRIPETGEQRFIVTSPADENKLGTEGYKEVLAKSKLNKDPRLNGILQRVGKNIAAAAARNDFRWEFALIESKEMNAWCMPGGKVAFYTGILPALQNEGAMAAVMGHEVAHATLRHAGQRISQQLTTEAVLGLLSTGLAGSKYHDAWMAAAGLGAQVGIALPYSRGHESEADEIGLQYMARAGYDPYEAVSFWERFGKATAGGAPPEFLSTHPGAATRIRDLKVKLPEARRLYHAAPKQLGRGEAL